MARFSLHGFGARLRRSRRADPDPEPPREAERFHSRDAQGAAPRARASARRPRDRRSAPYGRRARFLLGQDLSERNVAPGAAPIDLSVSLGSYYNPLVRRMRALAKPIVCAVNGVAAGAGANIALACDIVLAARSASFVQSFARLGLIPAVVGRSVRCP